MTLSPSGKTVTLAAMPGCRITAFREEGGSTYHLAIDYRGQVASVHLRKTQLAMGAMLERIFNDVMEQATMGRENA